MAEIQSPNASKIIAILLQRLGGPQYISADEFEQFDTSMPTLFEVNPDTGAMKCEVMPPKTERQ